MTAICIDCGEPRARMLEMLDEPAPVNPTLLGPYLLTIKDESALVIVSETYDGGMVEFHDAVTGKYRGVAGINWFNEPGHAVRYLGPIPRLPDPEKWL